MPFGWQQFESPFSPAECAERLQKAIDPSNLFDLPAASGTKPVYGFVENGWFDLRQRGPRNERGINALQGELQPGGLGTIVRFGCAWDHGPRWAAWLGVLAAMAFGIGIMALIVIAYFQPPPGPAPYTWTIAVVLAIVIVTNTYGAWRAAGIAEQQRRFLVEFLETTLKAIPPAK